MHAFGGICPNRQLGSCRCVFWLREYGKFYGDPRKDGLAVPEIRAIVTRSCTSRCCFRLTSQFHSQGSMSRVHFNGSPNQPSTLRFFCAGWRVQNRHPVSAGHLSCDWNSLNLGMCKNRGPLLVGFLMEATWNHDHARRDARRCLAPLWSTI